MLTKGALPEIRVFSSEFSDPDGSYQGMKECLKARIRMQRKIISKNFLVKLQKRKVGTSEIEATATRYIYGEEAKDAHYTPKSVQTIFRQQ